MCVSARVFALIVLSAAVAEGKTIIVRNGDNVILPCWPRLPNCNNTDWTFRQFDMLVALVSSGEVLEQGYRLVSLTSDCSLELLTTTESDAHERFYCDSTNPRERLSTYQLSVVSLTRTGDHQLSCSVTSTDCPSYKLRWLYDGKPFPQPEPLYGCNQTVTMCQDCEESLQEELFSCEVWTPEAPDEVKLFPLSRQSQGVNTTPPTVTTRGSSATGSSGNTGGTSEDTQPGGHR